MIIGLQTYTIRKQAKKSLPVALREVKRLGITHLELARVPFDETTVSAIKTAKMRVVSLQDKIINLEHCFTERIQFMQALRIDTAVVSVLPPSAIIGGKKAIKRFSLRLNALAKRYREFGIKLAFHHHDFEFRKLNRIRKFDILLETLDSEVKVVMDTYWIKKSKEDPSVWIHRLLPRLCGLHLRDHKRGKRLFYNISHDCAIGDGDIDFYQIFDLINTKEIYAVIEQNSKYPLVDIKKSITSLAKIGLETKKG